MKKLLLLPIVLFGAFTVATAQAPATTSPAADNPNAAEMKFDGMEYQFGNIKQGDVATHEFRFKNSGKEPLIISSATGSCGCTVPDWPKDPIKPGGSAVIKVTFNSTGKMGQQDKTVTIVSNAKEGTLVLHMKGTVEAKPVEAPATGSGTAAAPATTTATPAATSTAAPAKDSKATTPAAAPTDSKATTPKATKGKSKASSKGNKQ